MMMNFAKLSILMLLALPLMSQAEDVTKAQIVTSGEKPSQCISAVHVNQIDGKEVKVQPLGFEIDPGTHKIGARALINTSFCKPVGLAQGNNPTEPIEANFEAGKTYYLGFDHSASNRKDWKLVIWKVEDEKS
jgi:hypothetical protein